MQRKQVKMRVAEKIMLQKPHLSYDGVLAEIESAGMEKPARGSLQQVRFCLRKEGHAIPRLAGGFEKGLLIVRLGTSMAAIMKKLHENPRGSNKEIQEKLAAEGIKVHTKWVSEIRRSTKRYFPEKDFSPKPKPIELTEAQQKMIPSFQKLVNWALWNKEIGVLAKIDWPHSLKKEFDAHTNGEIPRLIKNYKPRRSLPSYVLERIGFLRKDFTVKSFMQGMALKRGEAKLLVKIIREQSNGAKNAAEIAARLHCSEQKVQELLRAYSFFKRTQWRLGRQKEQ